MEHDFIAIGDTVTDTFIRLLPDKAEVTGEKKADGAKICMNFGDKIPFEKADVIPAVGNSANAAVSASRLGLKSAIITHMGDDHGGEIMLERLKSEKIDTAFVSVNKGMPSNSHYVLWYKDDRTILIKHEEYDFRMPDIGEPKWLYLSSLGAQTLSFHDEVVEYIKKHPGIKLVFQPGTFQMEFGARRLAELYKNTELFFCNREEAMRILEADNDDIKFLMGGLHELGSKVPVITDGKEGSYASDGKQVWFMPNYPDPKPPLDRTGAGDAFASTYTSALILGKSVSEALTWAPINSMSVVQYVGAQEGLLTRQSLENYLKQAPADYKPSVFCEL